MESWHFYTKRETGKTRAIFCTIKPFRWHSSALLWMHMRWNAAQRPAISGNIWRGILGSWNKMAMTRMRQNILIPERQVLKPAGKKLNLWASLPRLISNYCDHDKLVWRHRLCNSYFSNLRDSADKQAKGCRMCLGSYNENKTVFLTTNVTLDIHNIRGKMPLLLAFTCKFSL